MWMNGYREFPLISLEDYVIRVVDDFKVIGNSNKWTSGIRVYDDDLRVRLKDNE